MFRLILCKITGLVVPNFGHFTSKTSNFLDFDKIHL